jgi:hypothetical protein
MIYEKSQSDVKVEPRRRPKLRGEGPLTTSSSREMTAPSLDPDPMQIPTLASTSSAPRPGDFVTEAMLASRLQDMQNSIMNVIIQTNERNNNDLLESIQRVVRGDVPLHGPSDNTESAMTPSEAQRGDGRARTTGRERSGGDDPEDDSSSSSGEDFMTDAAKAALAESKKLKKEIKAMENRRTSVISQLAESMGYTKEEAPVKMSKLAHDICRWATVENQYVKKPEKTGIYVYQYYEAKQSRNGQPTLLLVFQSSSMLTTVHARSTSMLSSTL